MPVRKTVYVAIDFNMKLPCVLMRIDKSNVEIETEAKIARKYFPLYTQRAEIPNHSLVISRYASLPYHLELEKDLACCGSQLLNNTVRHNWVANILNWYDILGDLTPKTWTSPQDIPDNISLVVKGRTNSRKHEWNRRMFANNKDEAIEVAKKLMDDYLISEQGVIYREYVPLVTFDKGLYDLPITAEWRVFLLDGEILTSGYYWSSMLEDEEKYETEVTEEVLETAKLAWTKLSSSYPDSYMFTPIPRFLVIDIAKTQDGRYIVIELNDGQMSGLSACSADELYKNLERTVFW